METLEPGTELAGFRIDGVAGRGGMGVVYRAHQPALERPVALKVITPALAEDDAFRARFVRESKAAASIDHPNVIPIYSAGEQDGVLYLAMRYVDGDDLRTLIRREGPLDPERAAHIVSQVASALDAAHGAGLVHRDVKPANVLLARGDHAYLTDFGLTKQTGGDSLATRPGHWVGTLGYVAPEQIRGERVDARADVYALGSVLFHALTGHAPFPRDSETATLFAHLNDPPPSVRDTVPSLPGAFDAILARALAKDPTDRYPSAGDLGRSALAAAGSAPTPREERSVAVGAAAPDHDTEAPTATGGTQLIDEPATPTPPAPAHQPAPAPRGPRRGLLGALGALILAAVAVAVVLASGGDGEGGSNGSTATTTGGPAGKVVRTVKADRPNSLTIADGVLWVTSSRIGTVARFSTRNGRRLDALEGLEPGISSIASGIGSIWVANQKTRSLYRFAPGAREPIGPPLDVSPGQPFSLDVSADRVWLGMRAGVGAPGEGIVREIIPGASKRRDRTVRGGVQSLAVDEQTLWVTNRRRAVVTRFDLVTRTGRRSRDIEVGQDPAGVALGGGYAWVVNSGESSVTRISLDGSKLKTIEVGARPADVAVAGGNVWVSNAGDGTLTRIDAANGAVVGRPVRVGRQPKALVADGNGVWVANVESGNVMQVSPE